MSIPAQQVTLPQRGYRIAPARALGAALLCWLAFFVVTWAVATDHASTIDSAGLQFWRDATLQPIGPAWLLEGVRDVSALGGVLLRNVFALMSAGALLFMRMRREAVLLALTVAIGWMFGFALKLLVGRARPEIVPHLTEAGGNSFPSGHSFNAAVVYFAIGLAFAAISPRQSVRIAIVACAAVISLTVAWSRVWLGVHWPSDALAGWLGGAGWSLAASAVLYAPARATAAQLPSETDCQQHRAT